MSDTDAVADRDHTFLRTGAIQQRMNCGGNIAHNIKEAFITVEQLLDAVESEDPLTDIDGIGPKTAVVIEDWYEHREERERATNSSTFERTSNSSGVIKFLGSWEDTLDIEVSDDE